MLILTANPQPKPPYRPALLLPGFCVFVSSASAKLAVCLLFKKEGAGESVGAQMEGEEREEEEREGDVRLAARESSNVNVPWTFLGVTIKPLVPLKLEEKTCDWIAEGEAGGWGLKGGREKQRTYTALHCICTNVRYTWNMNDQRIIKTNLHLLLL